MKKFLFIIVAVLIIGGLVFSGCAKTETTTTPTQQPTTQPTTQPTATQKTGGTLTMLWRGAGGNLGWPNGPGSMGELVMTNQIFYEPLLIGTVKNNQLIYQPCLAESWELSDDKKSVTFHLRQGVKFHDGTDFDAEAVKFNYDKIIEEGDEPNWESVEVLDKYTVRVNHIEWQNPAMDEFLQTSIIVSPTAYNKGMDYLSVHPTGTGPFIFESFEQDVQCTGVKNPDYWGEGPYIDKFVMKYVPDWNARKTALQTGEGDIALAELGKQTYDLRSLGFDVYAANDAVFSIMMSGANADSPFANKKVREAVEYAIDREALAEGIGFGEMEAPYQLDPTIDPAWDPNFVGREYDVQKAKDLMKEAGYENGFTTTLNPMPGSSDDAAVAVQDYLSEIGITVKIEYMESPKFFQFMTGQTWEGMVITGVPCSGNYNFTLLTFFSGTRPMYVSSPSTQALRDAVMASVNSPEIDISLIRKTVQVIRDDCIAIPLYQAGMGYGWYDYVMGGGVGEREHAMYWHPESFWLNK
jgi:peptide/nickel transport system substrate-binding protein